MRFGQVTFGLAVLAVLAWLPDHLSRYWISVAIGTLVLIYLAYCWNIVGGFIGQMSLAHAAFWAIGSYSYVLTGGTAGHLLLLVICIAAASSGAYALSIALLSYRFDVRGHYFALLTLAFTEIPAKLANNFAFLGAAAGIYMTTAPYSPKVYYLIILAMTACVIALTAWLARSGIGLCWVALRDNEQAAQAAGINPVRQKTLAFVLSAVLTACGGIFHAEYLHVVRPDISFDLQPLILVIVATYLGGRGTVWGPLLGIMFLRALDVLSSMLPIESERLNFALVMFQSTLALLLVIWFTRGGHSGSLLDTLNGLMRRRSAASAAS